MVTLMRHVSARALFVGVWIVLCWCASAQAALDECQRALTQQVYDFYNSTQLRFNVADRPNEIRDPAQHSKPISIWELPANSPGITTFGDVYGTPLVTTSGGCRIYNHQHSGMAAPGLPVASMSVSGATQSSMRTFAASPEDEYPFFVKFSLWTGAVAPTKILNPQYLQLATLRSSRFLNDPEILPDRAAIAYTTPGTNGTPTSHLFIYRDGHFSRGLIPAPEEGDTLMVLSALLSENFLASKEALEHFPDLAGVYVKGKFDRALAIGWVAKKVGPVIGDILFKSTFLEGVHFELHTQNEDVLFNRRGELKSFFVRDLFDAVDDPALLLVEGKDTSQVHELDFFGFLNQIEAPFPPNASYWRGSTVTSWYGMWYEQIDSAANFTKEVLKGRTQMQEVAGLRLIRRFKDMLAQRGIQLEALKGYFEFERVMSFESPGSTMRLVSLIGDLRDLWIKYRLDQHPAATPRSAESARIREALLASKRVISDNEFTGKLPLFRETVGRYPEPHPSTIETAKLNLNSAIYRNNQDYWDALIRERERNYRVPPRDPVHTIEFGELAGKPFARVKVLGHTSRYFIGF